MAVAFPVVPGQHFRQRCLDALRRFAILGQGCHVLHQVEQRARIAMRGLRQNVKGGRGQGDLQIGRAALGQRDEFGMAQRSQAQHVQAGEELPCDAEGRIFRCCGQKDEFARFHQRQKKILLRLAEAVKFIQNEDFHAGERAAQVLQAGFRRADAEVFFPR